MKFLIKKLERKQRTKKGVPIYSTGEDYLFTIEDSLSSIKIAEGKYKYKTGLTPNNIKISPVLTEDMKKAYIDKLDSVRDRVKEVYGEDALDETNKVFWGERGKIKLDSERLNTVFDDDKDINALILRFNIAAGGYEDLAPSFDMAMATGKKYYVVEEVEYNNEEFEENVSTKLKAMASLNSLYEKGSSENLLYLAWLVFKDTQGFTRNSSKEVLVKSLSDYIEGRLVTSDKKACAKNFLDYANMIKNDKEGFVLEAVFNIAVYFGLIVLVEGNYTTKERATVLGGNKKIALRNLMEARNIEELKELKKAVDKRLNK